MPETSPNTERVKNVLGAFLKRDPATIETHHSLLDSLGLDSMGAIELLYDVEDEFDLEIHDGDLRKLATVADVIAYVDRTMGDAEASS